MMSGEPIACLSSYSLVIILTFPHNPAQVINKSPVVRTNSSILGVFVFER